MSNDYYAVVRSTDHLAHYGVKGMKWGIRKMIERGAQKHTARKLGGIYNRSKEGSSYATNRAFFRNKAVRKAVDKLRSDIDAVNSASDAIRKFNEKSQSDFYKNKKLVNKYQTMLARKDAKKYGNSYANVLNGYRYGDLDQGYSYDAYASKSKSVQKQLAPLTKRYKAAKAQYAKKVHTEVNNMLGNYGSKQIGKKNTKAAYRQSLAANVENSLVNYAPIYSSRMKNRRR